jgi:hypothetical protein
VGYARFVRFGQPFGNLRGDFYSLSYGQRARAQQLAQGLPLDHLHGNVVSGIVLSELIDSYDIGMVEGGCGACFPFETL